jgi:uncharacterized protein
MFGNVSSFSLSMSRGLTALLAALMLAVIALPAAAQDTPAHRSYINPFPNGDRYRVVVVGDSMAEGLWEGAYRAFEDDPTVDIIQQGKKWTGFVNVDKFDWNAEIDQILKDGNYHVAVVMFGVGESQPIKKDGKLLKIGTEEWRQAYGERVETFIKKLRGANLATYWVGLPVMRSPGQSEDAQKLNDLFREKAFVNGAKYIETWEGFVDEQGRYSAYGPDMQGNTKRLRDNDGVHFTMRGYLKLAHFLEKELRKDLTLAKEERNIPLAGNEDEQAKVANRFAAAPQPETPEPDEAAAAGQEGDEDALQESQVGDVSVVRPTRASSIPAADLAEDSANASSAEPAAITEELPGGYTALATISAVTDLTLASSRPQLPLSQRPYYRVLIRGEQLEPKSGRGDDFTWPPS